MRLVHTSTLELHEFSGGDVPEYAILSHRWDRQEISFQEYQSIGSGNANHDSAIKSKAAYQKIKSFCHQARTDAIEYGWVDTCCIDKTSSAELSEAINSMYRWYQDAVKCYTYLNDVGSSSSTANEGKAGTDIWPFHESRWFTRGWTFQELIAPQLIDFYDNTWSLIGTKMDLSQSIEQITGIPERVLRSHDYLREYSVACRMSWASTRTTTREEDLAYCLMGIFDVHMPMLYGEGGYNAFIRLQGEILKTSNDHSIFAWKNPLGVGELSGLLAHSPVCFKDTGDYIGISGPRADSLLVTQTNIGISLNVSILASKDRLRAVLNCARRSQLIVRPCIEIICRNVSGSQFSRFGTHALEDTREDGHRQQIYVRQVRGRRILDEEYSIEPPEAFQVGTESVDETDGTEKKMLVLSCWISPQSYLLNSEPSTWPVATRTRWVYLHLAGNPTPSPAPISSTSERLMEAIFALPQFPETPAILIEFSLITLLIGRASDGRVAMQVAPEGLLKAVKEGRTIPDGLFVTNMQSLQEDGQLSCLSDDARIKTKVSKTRTPWSRKYHISIKTGVPGRPG